jgi:hypothetical protein
MIPRDGLPLVLMAIGCFDRQSANPLPINHRQFRLDWEKLTDDEVADALAILNSDKSQFSPRGFSETLMTASFGSKSIEYELIKYRSAFVAVTVENADAMLRDPLRNKAGGRILAAPHGYAEDENGRPLSMSVMMQHVTGQPEVVLRGDANSVLQLGAMPPANIENWTLKKANTIGQFLDVVERISASEWYRSPPSVTSATLQSGESELLEAVFPNDQHTQAVLAYFRQLHAADKLLEKSCKVYVDHASNPLKAAWVDDMMNSFVEAIDEPPFYIGQTTTNSRREIIRMFMYGAGLLHSESLHGDETKLASLVQTHSKHNAIMLLNSSLMDIFRFAARLHHVIRQDFDRWIKQDGLTAPDRIAIPDLFEGFRTTERRAIDDPFSKSDGDK